MNTEANELTQELESRLRALPADKKAALRAEWQAEDAKREREKQAAREVARTEAIAAAETALRASVRKLRSFYDADKTRTVVQNVLREVAG